MTLDDENIAKKHIYYNSPRAKAKRKIYRESEKYKNKEKNLKLMYKAFFNGENLVGENLQQFKIRYRQEKHFL